MLNKMREQASGFFAKVLLGLLVVSFGIWGIADIFRGYGSSALAEVGSQEITSDQYRTALNRELQQLSQQARRPISMADAHSMGLDSQVLGQLVAEAALDQRARDLGLGLTDKTIANSVMNSKEFQGPDGKFDHQRFVEILENAGYSEASFVSTQREFMLRRQILDALTGGTKAPQPLLDAVNTYQGESREVRYAVLGAAAIPPVHDPDAKTLTSFFDAHKNEFQTTERRSITALPVNDEIMAARQHVTDSEIAARYDQERAKFTAPEKRTIERITFKTMDEAKAAAAKIKAGTSFEDLAKARGLKPSDITLGTVTKGGLIDTAIANAAFALQQGGVSAPVQGQFSPALVHVTKIEPSITQPLAAVTGQIRDEVAAAKAQQAMNTLHDAIEDDRAGGATLTEIAAKRNLKLVKLDDVDAQGRMPDGTKAPGPGLTQLLDAAFKTVVGADNDPIRIDDSGYIWYNVAKIDRAHPQTLAQARSDVVAAWRREQVRQHLATKSQDVLKALRSGSTTLQQAAAAAKVSVQSTAGLTRTSRTLPQDFGTAAVSTVFSTAKDGYGVAEAASAPGRIVFEVTKVDTPKLDRDSALSKAIAQRLDQALQNDLATEYVLDLQNAYGVKVNQSAMAAVTGAPSDQQ